MEKLNATFEGEKMTLGRVWNRLRSTGDKGGLAILVTDVDNVTSLAEQINRRDSYPDVSEINGIPLRINGSYTYGFDVSIGDCNYEIDCEGGAVNLEVFLVRPSTLTVVEAPPAPPEPEKLEVKTDVNVSSLTMDELADIVSTYDEIHVEAVKELNNRINTFRNKL